MEGLDALRYQSYKTQYQFSIEHKMKKMAFTLENPPCLSLRDKLNITDTHTHNTLYIEKRDTQDQWLFCGITGIGITRQIWTKQPVFYAILAVSLQMLTALAYLNGTTAINPFIN